MLGNFFGLSYRKVRGMEILLHVACLLLSRVMVIQLLAYALFTDDLLAMTSGLTLFLKLRTNYSAVIIAQ